jgi:hypothetical protein
MLTRLKCWWFGCVPDYHAQFFDHENGWSEPPCRRCGALAVSYADCVGETRNHRTTELLHFWLVRRWVPAKCHQCGKRRREICDNCPPF